MGSERTRSASLRISAEYSLASPVTGLDDRTQAGSITFGGAIDTDEWDQAYAEQFTLSDTSSAATIDLYEFVNNVCEAVVGARVLGGAIQVASDAEVVVFEAGDGGGLLPAQWFLDMFPGGVALRGNGCLAVQDESFGALDATSRYLTASLNPGTGGGGEATVTVIVFIATA